MKINEIIKYILFFIYLNLMNSLFNKINFANFANLLNKNNNSQNLLHQKIIYLKSKKYIDVYICSNNSDYFIVKENNLSKYTIINKNDTLETILNKIDFDKNNLDIFLYNNILKKNIITISPGGIYGFYDTGLCSIIKKKYNLKNCIFSGASAGAWNSLFMSYKFNINKLIKNIFNINSNKFLSMKKIQLQLKENILKYHSNDEFNLKNIYISVCVFENMSFHNYIYTDFVDLNDVLDCCIASSNIPFITGKIICRYNGKISFDGGFLKNKSILFANPLFNINNSIWGKKKIITSLFGNTNNIINLHKLYNEGKNDTLKNIKILDKYFYAF